MRRFVVREGTGKIQGKSDWEETSTVEGKEM
jgi:hypothetical protein